MVERWRGALIASCLVVVVLTIGASGPAMADTVDGLIVAQGPVTLGSGDPATGSVSVINPTDQTIEVAEAPADQNDCKVRVTEGTVAAGSSRTVTFSAASTKACPDVAAAGLKIRLEAAPEGGTGTVQPIVVTTAEAATGATEVKGTGLKLPDDDVFLRRSGDDLVGAMEVTNTTTDDVVVIPSTVGDDCATTPAEPPEKAPGKGVIEPGGSAPITIRIPAACDLLDTSTLDLTVLVSSTDGTAYEYPTVTVKAEVDWEGATPWFGILTVVSFFLVLIAALAATASVNQQNKTKNLGTVGLRDGLASGKDAPKTWLTGLAAVVPALTTLFTASGVLDGLTGTTATAPTTLVVVTAAVSVVLLAAATFLTNTTAVIIRVDKAKQDAPRIAYFALASWMTGTAGLLSATAVWIAAEALDLPGGDVWVNLTGLALVAFILVYLPRTVFRTIRRLATPRVDPSEPEPPADLKPTPPEVLAGAMVALAPCYVECDHPDQTDQTNQTDHTEREPMAAGDAPATGDARTTEWLTRARAVASLAVNLPDPPIDEVLEAAKKAAELAKKASVAATRAAPEEAAADLETASADAEKSAALLKQATAAADAGDEAMARALANESADKAATSMAASQAADAEDAATVDGDPLEAVAAELERLRELTTSSGDGPLLAPPELPKARRPITEFMI